MTMSPNYKLSFMKFNISGEPVETIRHPSSRGDKLFLFRVDIVGEAGPARPQQPHHEQQQPPCHPPRAGSNWAWQSGGMQIVQTAMIRGSGDAQLTTARDCYQDTLDRELLLSFALREKWHIAKTCQLLISYFVEIFSLRLLGTYSSKFFSWL